jgi:hypothetical protein
VGRDSSVGITPRNELDGMSIESRWRARSSEQVQNDPEAHLASYTMGTGFLSEAGGGGQG